MPTCHESLSGAKKSNKMTSKPQHIITINGDELLKNSTILMECHACEGARAQTRMRAWKRGCNGLWLIVIFPVFAITLKLAQNWQAPSLRFLSLTLLQHGAGSRLIWVYMAIVDCWFLQASFLTGPFSKVRIEAHTSKKI